MQNTKDALRDIPQVDRILQNEEIEKFIPLISRGIVLKIVRKEIELFRENIKKGKNTEKEDLITSIIEKCGAKRLERLQRVINGTGVVIHTNLGRSPISKEILKELYETLPGYSNLELNIPAAKRGKRGGFAEELICCLTSCEDALIVNNNASSLFLIF